jgi:general secretion pathway protein N
MSVQGAKLLTVLLAAACGVLLLLAFVLQIGFGRGYRWFATDDDAVTAVGGGSVDRQAFKLPPETDFAETNARPIFNEDRKPTPDIPPDAPVVPPSAPLNISLTGVILTPQLRLAMIHDNAKNDPFSVKEGMPLPGDLGGWTLTKVKQRSAMFKESAGDEVEVELSTAVAGPKAGTPPRPTGAAAAPAAPPAGSSGNQFGPRPAAPPAPAKPDSAQAEQMQHRIEERRKQMRDEAERLKQQQPNPQQH